ncbi:MAG: hypothetical protein LPD71_12125 [Shewanella sp.]|nr:hypothetical protein [Shewanella sp.]MCF1439452.1 hypothetical protein [Shewanella sp.]
MKTMSNSLFLSTKLILLATPLLFNQAYAYSGECGTLHLLVPASIYKNQQIYAGDPVVNHGSYKGCEEIDDDTGECVDFVFGQTYLGNGPDINIIFREMNSTKTAKISVQQNYCFMEAGDIAVKAIKGSFDYDVTGGSWGYHTPGVVKITSIKPSDSV